jgi:hypothetical protein
MNQLSVGPCRFDPGPQRDLPHPSRDGCGPRSALPARSQTTCDECPRRAEEKKKDEEAPAQALGEAETERKAKEEQKEQRMALCARAGHFHIKGMRELETDNVIANPES